MSRTTDWIINTADDRAESDRIELAELREEVARLRAAQARAFEVLDEGDPAGFLREYAHGYQDDVEGLRMVAEAIERARAILGESTGE
jgi:hypothetical protein